MAFAWPAATALAGVGILTMALIEIVVTLFRLRARFRRRRFEAIMLAQYPQDDGRACHNAGESFKQTEGLVGYGDPLNTYIDSLGDLTSRLSAAYRTMLSDAQRFESGIRGLAPRIDSATLTTLQDGEGSTPTSRDKHAKARAVAMGYNQHFLKAVEAELEHGWARATQSASVILSILVIGLSATFYYWDKDPGQPTIFFWLIIAVFGGTVAPVAKNIVTALRNVKNRTQ